MHRTWERSVLIACALGFIAVSPARAAECPRPDCDPALVARRSLSARRLSGPPPAIDGRLDEPVWSEAPVATGFVQASPRPAAAATLRSEARVLVDEEAIYFGLRYFDPEPSKILAPLARRDDETTSDWAFVEIDSRHDRRSGFSFGVNPRGVQVDGLWSQDDNYDASWNAVWEAAARIDSEGWTAEIRIPFSQLPFRLPPEGSDLVWGINFYRYSPGHGEKSNWSPRFAGLAGVVSQFNDLHLPAPAQIRRLEVTPYLAPRLGNDGPGRGRKEEVEAGADLKVGLGSSFSLTATLLPDFGQVEADPSQVNLTAFELFQAERRPFFLEGLDVFQLATSLPFATRETSFADESPFYSRRIGRPPRGELPADVTPLSVPTATTLLGAAKLSGEISGGWTLGAFSALTDREQAEVRRADGTIATSAEVPVEARAATTVARALKSFDHGDSSFGLFAADLHRLGLEPALAGQEVRDALALGGELQHRFGGGAYEVRSWGLTSRLSGEEGAIARVAEAPQHYFQRPDSPRAGAPYGTSLSGTAAETRLSKVGGAFLWDLVGRAISPGFDVDEIGFQRNADWLLLAFDWKYQRFRPGRFLRDWTVGSGNVGLGWTWNGLPRTRVGDAYISLDTVHYWTLKATVTRELSTLSTGWLRGGPALLLPPRTTFALSLATDQRKASYGTLDATVSREPASGTHTLVVSPLVNVRTSDQLQGSLGLTYEVDTIGWQPLGLVDRATGPEYEVGRVRQETLSFTTRADLTFSPRLALQLYLQPFGSLGRYDRFQRLVSPRAAAPGDRFVPLAPGEAALPAPNGESRSLNGSLVLRWEYGPGSFLTAVWNHQRTGLSGETERPLSGTLSRLFGDPPTNVLLVKLSRRFGA